MRCLEPDNFSGCEWTARSSLIGDWVDLGKAWIGQGETLGGRGGALGGGKDGGQHFLGSAPAWQDFYDVSFFMDSTHSPDIITLDNHGKHIGPFPAKQKVNFLPNFF